LLFDKDPLKSRVFFRPQADQLQNCESAPEFSTLPDWSLGQLLERDDAHGFYHMVIVDLIDIEP
jgi:hypothetical protein